MKRIFMVASLATMCFGMPVAMAMTYDASAWYMGELGVTNLLNAGITGKGVKVGMVDTGIRPIVNGSVTNMAIDVLGGDTSQTASHGLGVASIIKSDKFGIGLDQVLTVPTTTATGRFLVYEARNRERETICRLRVDVVSKGSESDPDKEAIIGFVVVIASSAPIAVGTPLD